MVIILMKKLAPPERLSETFVKAGLFENAGRKIPVQAAKAGLGLPKMVLLPHSVLKLVSQQRGLQIQTCL